MPNTHTPSSTRAGIWNVVVMAHGMSENLRERLKCPFLEFLSLKSTLVICATAKKPSEAAPKPRKAPAPKAKKPDKSVWDSDSDTGSKKQSAPALKGTARAWGPAGGVELLR